MCFIKLFNAFGSCDLLGGSQYESIFEQKYLKNSNSKRYYSPTPFEKSAQ